MRKCSYPATQELSDITMDSAIRHTTHLPVRRRHSRSLTDTQLGQATGTVNSIRIPTTNQTFPYYRLTNFQLCHTFFLTTTVAISYSPTTHRILLRTNKSYVLLSAIVYTFIDSRETLLNWRKLCKSILRIFLFTHTYGCCILLISFFS